MIQVNKINFGEGSFQKGFEDIYSSFENDKVVWLVDDAVKKNVYKKLPEKFSFYLNIKEEPKTEDVDFIVSKLKKKYKEIKCIGIIGGGSLIDLGKAISVMLTNDGKSENYQGWNLVKTPPVSKYIFPSLAGTGAEATRSAVLISPLKKQGINSDYCLADAIYSDPKLISSVPKEIEFFSGMDCYIHAVESCAGQFGNSLTRSFAKSSMEFCENYFLNDSKNKEELLTASFLAGTAIMNSEVGVTHVLSYGLSFLFNIPHGKANCIIFSHLENLYGKPVKNFKRMLKKNKIELPRRVSSTFTESDLEEMYRIGLKMEKPLQHIFGKEWKNRFSKKFVFDIYKKI